MNITMMPGALGQNGLLQIARQHKPPVRNAQNEALQRISQQILERRPQEAKASADFADKFTSDVDGTKYWKWKDMPNDLLEDTLRQWKFSYNQSRMREDNLTGFREQLSVFDRSIQTCRDMANGVIPRLKGRTEEDVAELLDSLVRARELFLHEGAAYLGIGTDDLDRSVDRELAAAGDRTAHIAQGAANISREFFKRGCEGGQYQFDPESPGSRETLRLELCPQLGGGADAGSVLQIYWKRAWDSMERRERGLNERINGLPSFMGSQASVAELFDRLHPIEAEELSIQAPNWLEES